MRVMIKKLIDSYLEAMENYGRIMINAKGWNEKFDTTPSNYEKQDKSFKKVI